MSSSARVEIATRDALAVKQNQALMEELRKQRLKLKDEIYGMLTA